ncbi:MAG: STAS domain-containing protein [Lachnospiraceae bacterium]|nr:STAS domain-containing protein [Lachnospiraceae bacterium]
MTAASEASQTKSTGKAFKADFSKDGKSLLCSLAGRLDTITAPELLTGFNDYRGEDITEITVDMSDTEYISSAGLRVLLSMCKSLPSKDSFHVVNYSKTIKDILEVTGFDQLFGIEE